MSESTPPQSAQFPAVTDKPPQAGQGQPSTTVCPYASPRKPSALKRVFVYLTTVIFILSLLANAASFLAGVALFWR